LTPQGVLSTISQPLFVNFYHVFQHRHEMSFIQRTGPASSPTRSDSTKEFKFATLRFIPPTTYESAKRTIEDLMLQATTVLMQKAMHFEDDHSWEIYSESLDAYQSAGQHLQQIAEEMEGK